MSNILNMDEEVRCNYKVSAKMKKVWDVEMDITNKIDEICRKNNIKYVLCGGSLLGAIRHKGFIPWDDDIDIAMLREDYDKFLEIAKKELKNPYVIQDYKTEDGYYYGHAQIRNSNTTAFIIGDELNDFNHGIFVDIFPFDNLPDNKIIRRIFIFRLKLIKKNISIINSFSQVKGWKKVLKKIYIKFFGLSKNREIIKLNNYVLKYDKKNTKQCTAIGFNPNDALYEREWFNDIDYYKFENVKYCCPNNYDEWLRRQYNDYMQIPKNLNGTYHGKVFFDPTKSFKEYDKDYVIDRLKSNRKKEKK